MSQLASDRLPYGLGLISPNPVHATLAARHLTPDDEIALGDLGKRLSLTRGVTDSNPLRLRGDSHLVTKPGKGDGRKPDRGSDHKGCGQGLADGVGRSFQLAAEFAVTFA